MCNSESLKVGIVDGEQQQTVNRQSVGQVAFFPLSLDPEDIRAGYLKNRLKNFIARLIKFFSEEGWK